MLENMDRISFKHI
jgi:glycerol uptake facilitator-like aquaporin